MNCCTGWSVGWPLGQSVDWLTRKNTGIPDTGVFTLITSFGKKTKNDANDNAVVECTLYFPNLTESVNCGSETTMYKTFIFMMSQTNNKNAAERLKGSATAMTVPLDPPLVIVGYLVRRPGLVWADPLSL